MSAFPVDASNCHQVISNPTYAVASMHLNEGVGDNLGNCHRASISDSCSSLKEKGLLVLGVRQGVETSRLHMRVHGCLLH